MTTFRRCLRSRRLNRFKLGEGTASRTDSPSAYLGDLVIFAKSSACLITGARLKGSDYLSKMSASKEAESFQTRRRLAFPFCFVPPPSPARRFENSAWSLRPLAMRKPRPICSRVAKLIGVQHGVWQKIAALGLIPVTPSSPYVSPRAAGRGIEPTLIR